MRENIIVQVSISTINQDIHSPPKVNLQSDFFPFLCIILEQIDTIV